MNRHGHLRTRALKQAAIGAALCASAHAWAADPVTRTICVYDPVGANGPVFHAMENYFAAALSWGVKFDPKPYTDEDVAAADFKTGKCDAVDITGVRNMEFVKFAGSLDMAGGLQTYDEERKAIAVMVSPKAARHMSSGNFEVAAVVPGGKIYLFARHRENLVNLQKVVGKKAAVLSFDKQAPALANSIGAAPVPATIATFGKMFNNGSVEYVYAPAFVYEAFEMFRGLGTTGGIADYVLGMLSLQLDIHKDRFPAGFGQQSRTWVYENATNPAIKRITAADNAIPEKYWEHIDGEHTRNYSSLLVNVRQNLWNNNWYDHTMQHMLKKIRCQSNPGVAECTQDSEGGPA